MPKTFSINSATLKTVLANYKRRLGLEIAKVPEHERYFRKMLETLMKLEVSHLEKIFESVMFQAFKKKKVDPMISQLL